jgi:hypothetical protein
VTNTRSNVANRLVYDLTKKYRGEISRLISFPELVTDTRGMICDTGMDRLR